MYQDAYRQSSYNDLLYLSTTIQRQRLRTMIRFQDEDTIVNTETSFKTLARLHPAMGKDLLIDRRVCVLPKTPSQSPC